LPAVSFLNPLAYCYAELLATMWPGEYRAGLNPLVVVDEQGRVVARGASIYT